jgi:hypothetical protein
MKKREKNKKITTWISVQNHNYIHNIKGMKDIIRREKWTILINNHPEYFMSIKELWDRNYNLSDKFILNKERSPNRNSEQQSEKYLGLWISKQMENYKHKKNLLKNKEYIDKWLVFVNKHSEALKNFDIIKNLKISSQ